MFGAFSGGNFFPAFGLKMETYKVAPRIHSACGEIREKSASNVNTFHAVDVKTLLRYFERLNSTFTAISWLNDCENMKLVVPTHAVFFH